MTQDLLDIYSDYLIAQSQHATATGLSNLLEGAISHDRFTRLLNKNAFSGKDLWRYVKPQVRKQEQNQGVVLIIDFEILCSKLVSTRLNSVISLQIIGLDLKKTWNTFIMSLGRNLFLD